jgi:hypothetical protein
VGAAAVRISSLPKGQEPHLRLRGLTCNFSRLANVAGTQEPIYGPSAIKSVAEEAATTPYTELTRDDLKWEVMESTSVETQTFYVMSEAGQLAFAQVIYSNVA